MFLTQLLPLSLPWLLVLAFCYGAIIGSFLNVYIYRFHTGKSLSGRSHCLSCGSILRVLELIPLFSYLGLRGRCRSCGSFVSPRYFVVEAATGLLFIGSLLIAGNLLEMAYLWAICSVLVVIVVYDIRHYIIPDALTFSLTVFVLSWLAFSALLGTPYLNVLYTILGTAAASGFLFFLWFISKGRWIGFGDVKLAFPLGLIVGATNVFSMMVLSFWIGAGISLLLIFAAKLQRGQLGLRFLPANLTMSRRIVYKTQCLGSLHILIDNRSHQRWLVLVLSNSWSASVL
jgi:leader peptidase (prepilin peptidase)/N-methyltransferase